MPAGWTRVSEGIGSRLFEQRRGRRNYRRLSGGLFSESMVFYGFGVWALLGDGEAD